MNMPLWERVIWLSIAGAVVLGFVLTVFLAALAATLH